MKQIYSVCAFLIVNVSIAFAQVDLTVTIQNFLTNEYISDIDLILINKGLGLEKTQTTNSMGRTTFRGLQETEGYFVKTLESDRFIESVSGEIILRSNQNREINLFIFESRTINMDEVEITAYPSASINRTNAEVSFELKQKELLALPVEGRDITRALYRLPNVSQATGFYPEAPNVSINGANSLFTSYLIDGMDNNERFLGGQKFAMPSGFAQNISVLTNNFSAEYGNTANGIVNITTRSGSNQFSGEAFLIHRPGPALDGASEFLQRDLSGNFVKDGFKRYQAGAGFGGALKKDKTFYYVNFEHMTDIKDNLLNSPALGVNETVRGQNHFSYLSTKLDHNWSSKWRSSMRMNLGLVNIDRQGGGLSGGVAFPSAANQQDRNSFLLASRNIYVSEKFSAQTNVQFARFRWNYASPTAIDNPLVTVLAPTGETAAVLGHPGYQFDSHENTIQWQQKFAFYKGAHTLKTGIELISSGHQLYGGGVPQGSYTVQLNDEQLATVAALNLGANLSFTDIPADVEVLSYGVELRPNQFGKRQNIFSIYFEDQWSANDKLNLTLGLRYDYDNLSKGGGTNGDLNNLSPRLNFNYKLGSRSALRGGYGIFYDKVVYAIYSDALQQNTTDLDYQKQIAEFVKLGILPSDTDIERVTFDGNLTANPPNVTYLNGPIASSLQELRAGIFSNERRILNPNGYQNPYSHQLTVGYQHQVNQHTLFFVDFVHNRSFDLFRLVNLNAAAPFSIDPDNVRIQTPTIADENRPIPIVDGSSAIIRGEQLAGVARNVVMTESGGEAHYSAATFNLQKTRGNSNLAYRLNYTLSFLENNTEDINFRALDGNNFENEWGPSINDRRHIINAIGSWFPSENFSVTLAALLQSGQPVNRIPDASAGYRSIDPTDQMIYQTTDLNGDGSSFGDAYVGNSDRFPGEMRNSDRLPWSRTFDISMQYIVPLSVGRLAIRADIFNLFNTQNLSGYSNNATQSNQIQIGAAGSGIVRKNAGAPRQFQFGLNYRW